MFFTANQTSQKQGFVACHVYIEFVDDWRLSLTVCRRWINDNAGVANNSINSHFDSTGNVEALQIIIACHQDTLIAAIRLERRIIGSLNMMKRRTFIFFVKWTPITLNNLAIKHSNRKPYIVFTIETVQMRLSNAFLYQSSNFTLKFSIKTKLLYSSSVSCDTSRSSAVLVPMSPFFGIISIDFQHIIFQDEFECKSLFLIPKFQFFIK